MKKAIKILLGGLITLIAAAVISGCSILGSGIDAAATPKAQFPEAPSLQDFKTIVSYMAAVEAYPVKLAAAHDAAVAEAVANRDHTVAKADAKFESEVAKIRDNFAKAESSANARAKHRIGAVASNDDVSFNEAVVKAEAILEADHVNALASARKSYDEAEKSRNDAVSKAKADFANTKGKLATEMQQRLDATDGERKLVSSFDSVDDLQQQVNMLTQQVADLETIQTPALVATPCIQQPSFTG